MAQAQPDAVYDALFYNYSPDIIIDRIAGIPVVIAPRFKLKYFAKNDDDAISYALNLSNQLASAKIAHIVFAKTPLSLTGSYSFSQYALVILSDINNFYQFLGGNVTIALGNYNLFYINDTLRWSGVLQSDDPSSIPNITGANLQNWFKGNNVAVAAGATSLAVTLSQTLPSTNYAVYVTPQWNTTVWITGKTTTGFTINFGTAAPTGGSYVDWVIFF